MVLTEQQSKLFDWVKKQHGDQKRKYTGDPYWFHLKSVANLSYTYENRAHSVEISLCHDLLEDTSCDADEFADFLFQCRYELHEIDHIVDSCIDLKNEFTSIDYGEMNRSRRKNLENRRIRNCERVVHSVKCADIIDNISSIVLHDRKFALTYVPEKLDQYSFLNKAEKTLHALCGYTIIEAMKQLDIL